MDDRHGEQSYGLPFRKSDIQRAHDEVLAIVLDTDWPARDLNGMSIYPAGWCSAMSYTIGRLLLHRNLGQWRIAANGRHDWLEYISDDGCVAFSVDATQHQFSGFTGPWIGYGPAPMSHSSPNIRYADCGQEPTSWAKRPELILSEETLRQLG